MAKMFATNLDGVFHVFQAAARHMTERAEAGDKFGRLVATSSLASLFGTARNEHYAGTKAALNALCRALAVELARYGVTANAILPGWIKSDMTAGTMANDKFVANVMPRIPMRRFGEPRDFGGIAVYMMSKASSYHTADMFVIDGGYTAFLSGVGSLRRVGKGALAPWPAAVSPAYSDGGHATLCPPLRRLPTGRAPAVRGVQYAAPYRFQSLRSSGILGHPLSRVMTARAFSRPARCARVRHVP